MTRVSVPFTEGHYYGRAERPNTELADNSRSIAEINKTDSKYEDKFYFHITATSDSIKTNL